MGPLRPLWLLSMTPWPSQCILEGEIFRKSNFANQVFPNAVQKSPPYKDYQQKRAANPYKVILMKGTHGTPSPPFGLCWCSMPAKGWTCAVIEEMVASGACLSRARLGRCHLEVMASTRSSSSWSGSIGLQVKQPGSV
jgi:hypothetical protein